jgi:hypothetical protein
MYSKKRLEKALLGAIRNKRHNNARIIVAALLFHLRKSNEKPWGAEY